MAKAKAIIKRRKVVVNTRKITKTMELVSTAKYKQSFNRVASARPYRDTLRDMMRDLVRAGTEVDEPLLARREPERHVTLLLLTSNRGLCGGFNTNLIKTARVLAAEERGRGVEVALHVAGKKGMAYFRYLRESLAGAYTHFGDRPRYEDVEKLAQELMAAYAAGRTDRVAVTYQRFYSAGMQRPCTEVLLPIAVQPDPAGAEPYPAGLSSQVEYLYSPDAESLLRALAPAHFRTALYHVFLENAVGEQRARMVAMKNATDNAETMIRTLTRRYNRARQTQITNEISEIMGGVEALK